MEPIKPLHHKHWLKRILARRDSRLFIAEIDGEPVGNIRVDYSKTLNRHELSYVIAPEHRRKGYGQEMLKLTVDRLTGLITAKVKETNIASKKIAAAIGMYQTWRTNGFIYYSKLKGEQHGNT
jgi:RimJ/RimL family protein N-acetyltransferase